LELIAEGLAHNSSVLSLDLSNNAISSVGAIELAEALHSSKCRVTELLLSNNHIGEWLPSFIVVAPTPAWRPETVKLSQRNTSAQASCCQEEQQHNAGRHREQLPLLQVVSARLLVLLLGTR